MTGPMDETYLPPDAFQSQARVGSMAQYRDAWERSVDEPDVFWLPEADRLRWFHPPARALEYDPILPHKARWFPGGRLNASVNCLDRHVDAGNGGHTALVWEGEPVDDDADAEAAELGGGVGEVRRISYQALLDDVCRCANALKSMGVRRGDVVTIYLPMIPEAVVAMLACARIGAPHSVVFGGFSANAIADRLRDADSRFIITADGGHRRGKVLPLKANVDAASKTWGNVERVLVVRHAGGEVAMAEGRDVWWDDALAEEPDRCEPASMEASDRLFVLYTSGSTGKPKGIVHGTGGYLVHAYATCRYVFDLRTDDVYWCTADVGWVTGHTYVTYGPLMCGATVLLYEGAPDFPDWGRLWRMVERHRATVFYTAPTAIRAFMKAGREWVDASDLSSLSLLGTVGEPINPEAWRWYHEVVGDERCPVVDTWWQTETGGHMLAPMPGATPTRPGSCCLPMFGVDAAVVDPDGVEVAAGETGLLVVRRPWPGMLLGILNDEERYVQTYWTDVPGMYFSGDGARRDEDGYFWVTGRMDDVLNVSGHRLGTAEVESALVLHPAVAEAAVVGVPHDVKGEAVAAFVTLRAGYDASEELKAELVSQVSREIGSFARPEVVRFTDALPKTRSGKIMRRLLRDVAAGRESSGDVTTLEDAQVLSRLREDGD